MLRMSKLTDYGTIVMAYLARETDGPQAANDIAAQIQVGGPTVAKILKRLAQTGLVISHRGAKGGYVLARPATKISMMEIIDALEGPIGLTECGSAPGLCSQESSCSVRGNWQRINTAVREALSGVSLAEMTQPMGRQTVAPPSVPRLRANPV